MGRLLPWCGVSGVGRSPAPTARPLGGLPGPTTYWLWVRGGAGVGTRHQPHSARFCVLWGRHEGARGGRLLSGCGAPGVGRSPTPNHPPSGRAAGAHYPLAVGAGGCRCGGPVTKPTARALASWLCALWGRHDGARGGRLLPGCGASGVWHSPTPDCPPSGRAAGAHYPLAVGAGGCGRGDLSPTPQRALSPAGFARCGGGMRVPGGGASCLGVGRPGSRALRPPTARPLGGLPGPTTHWLWVRGGAGVGTRHQPHSARSCVLLGRHEGARGRRLLPGCGSSGVGRSPTPDCPPSGRAAGAHYPLAVGAGGCGRGNPSPNPQRALLRAGFARCAGGTARIPGGAPPAWVWGVRGRALSHPRLPALWAGCWGPLPTGCVCGGGAGVGTRHQPHSARSCQLPLRAVGAARGRPGGAPPAWVWGVRGRALSVPRLPSLWAGCRGPPPTGCGCGGVRTRGPVTNPTARALACCGGGMRVPGGAASCLGMGRTCHAGRVCSLACARPLLWAEPYGFTGLPGVSRSQGMHACSWYWGSEAFGCRTLRLESQSSAGLRMQPYPQAPDLVWPGHLHGTGCLSARAMDNGFPAVVCRLCLGLGCAWVRVWAAPRHSWLGCWFLCVLVCVLRLYPATPGWGVRRGCVCLGSGFGCAPPLLFGWLGCACFCARSAFTPPLLAGVCGVGVCALARVSAAPRHPWQGWWGVCLLVCVLRLYPATLGWGVRCGFGCLGSGFGSAPPLLAWVLGCACLCACAPCTPPLLAGVCGVGVCAWIRVSAAPRHSWLGCWGVCVLVCVLRLYPATSGWVVRCTCVCLGSGFGVHC